MDVVSQITFPGDVNGVVVEVTGLSLEVFGRVGAW